MFFFYWDRVVDCMIVLVWWILSMNCYYVVGEDLYSFWCVFENFFYMNWSMKFSYFNLISYC